MSKLTGEFLWKLLLFTAACFLLQYFIQDYLAGQFTFIIPLWRIYTFLVFLTLAGYLMVLFVHFRDPEKTGVAFIAIGFIKILAAVLFLYPLISAAGGDLVIQVLAFFAPYFLYLGFDTYFTVRLISKK